MSDVDPKPDSANVRIEIYTAGESAEEVRVHDVTHLRDLIRLSAELDERERKLAEREQTIATRGIVPAPAATAQPTEPPDFAAENEQRRAWQTRLADAEEKLRERIREIDEREAEVEARAAVREADLEVREDALERRERALDELERRLEQKESELAVYVAQLQGELGRREPVY
jgi:DNA repair exonuclease SbcCD ATPase subunit